MQHRASHPPVFKLHPVLLPVKPPLAGHTYMYCMVMCGSWNKLQIEYFIQIRTVFQKEVKDSVYSVLSVVGEEFDIVVLSQQTLCNHNAGFCEVTGRASRVK